MQGGMAGSHLRWSVYEDMVNKVWPQCSEQERRNLWLIMRRDLGSYWRPDEWSGFDLANAHGEGEWRPENEIKDTTPWMYFRHVLARFDPDNQWAVTIKVKSESMLEKTLIFSPKESIISCPTLITAKGCVPTFDMSSAPLIIRAYRWQDDYRLDWHRRIAPDIIVKAEQLEIPDTGEM
jgi:hypothetical protein